MECPAQGIVQDALCMILANERSQPTLTYVVVGQHLNHNLQSDSFCHQTLHPPSISQNIRAKSKSEHGHVHRSLYCYCGYFHILSGRYWF